MKSRAPRFAFAGDRALAVEVLEFLLSRGERPAALLLTAAERATHARQLLTLCELPEQCVLWADAFRWGPGRQCLRQLELDFIVAIHFPYVFPASVLEIPRRGVLNLHPGYLPYNRGWHTPSWAILDDTPYGATLHWMDQGLDTGAIVHQRQLDVLPHDTAHTLYERVQLVELAVFKEAWPEIVAHAARRERQNEALATSHRRTELFDEKIRRIDLDAPTTARALIQRLRALTTNHVEEAAYFELEGQHYRVQIRIEPVDASCLQRSAHASSKTSR